MNDTIEQQAEYAANADQSTPRPLWRGGMMFYPPGYFLRKVTMIRPGADGVPELVTA